MLRCKRYNHQGKQNVLIAYRLIGNAITNDEKRVTAKKNKTENVDNGKWRSRQQK